MLKRVSLDTSRNYYRHETVKEAHLRVPLRAIRHQSSDQAKWEGKKGQKEVKKISLCRRI
jgi:hypothetical protein